MIFSLRIMQVKRGGSWEDKGNVERWVRLGKRGRRGTDRSERESPCYVVSGVCYCLAPLHNRGSREKRKKLLVFLKAQEADVRGESGGERGRRQ